MTMIDRGFIPEFPKEVLTELDSLKEPAAPGTSVKDLRDLEWVSIDNDDSLDLDQLTYAEGSRIYVAIADVDALVKRGSFIDRQAEANTTSVYTPAKVFPMLPPLLSNDLTSLNESADRCAIVIEMEVRPDGHFELMGVYPSFVRNRGKLTYRGVGALFEEKTPSQKVLQFAGQLQKQNALAQSIQKYREQKGAIQFAERDFDTVMREGVAVEIQEKKINLANKLIENFMIAANVSVTRYLNSKNKLSIRRVVQEPKRWDRIVVLARANGGSLPSHPDPKTLRVFLLDRQKKDPDHFPELSLAIIKLIGRGEYMSGLPGQNHLGHFDLAEMEYAHTTAPNRRYPDLIMQRIVKSAFYVDAPSYTKEELSAIAMHCTVKENDAVKVERKLAKCAAAMVMQKEIGRTYKALVTGASEKGTWVRLLKTPIEGKLVSGYQGLDVGDYVEVKLVRVDIFNGFIDFTTRL